MDKWCGLARVLAAGLAGSGKLDTVQLNLACGAAGVEIYSTPMVCPDLSNYAVGDFCLSCRTYHSNSIGGKFLLSCYKCNTMTDCTDGWILLSRLHHLPAYAQILLWRLLKSYAQKTAL